MQIKEKQQIINWFKKNGAADIIEENWITFDIVKFKKYLGINDLKQGKRK